MDIILPFIEKLFDSLAIVIKGVFCKHLGCKFF
jgi:hypothetical protein